MLTTVNERLSSSTIIARNKSSRIEFLSSQRKFVEIIFIAMKIRIFIIFYNFFIAMKIISTNLL